MNEYPSSGEISYMNGPVRGDCMSCDALLFYVFIYGVYYVKRPQLSS